jgi:hypothetical protein
MCADLEKRVKALVARETGMRVERISLTTRVAQDIGCDGDDAVELFEAFAKEFDVDLKGIQWNKHFGPEGGIGCPLGCLFAVFGWLVMRNKIVNNSFADDLSEPVTISDLVEAARAKRWVKTYPGGRSNFDQ